MYKSRDKLTLVKIYVKVRGKHFLYTIGKRVTYFSHFYLTVIYI